MTNQIESLAGVHLGKTSDGQTMMRYETPKEIDPSLLVGIPRHLNREQYGITNADFGGGIDVWRAFEFSYLRENGAPANWVLEIRYPSFSPNIVESKSLKLYLNSFNMAVIPDQDMKFEDEYISRTLFPRTIAKIVREHLAPVLGVQTESVSVHMFSANDKLSSGQEILHGGDDDILHLETLGLQGVKFTEYTENPDLLQVIEDGRLISETFRSSSLRSNCRVTNQPDWGDVLINYRSRKRISPISLYKYIVSLRNENHFHEEIAELIFKRLKDLLGEECHELTVACFYTRRGGIDINPIRSTMDDHRLGHRWSHQSFFRTIRQ